MPLGDSITGSPGCWRAMLYERITGSGRAADFVGTLNTPHCGVPFDADNEGHGGFLATGIARENRLPGWLAATRPDVVLVHLGTNDMWSSVPAADVLSAYTTLVRQMRAANPRMRVIVAQLIPLRPEGCTGCDERVRALNAAIPGWARAQSTAQSPVTVVDQYTGFDTAADTYDGVHPVASGDRKIADRWFPALAAALDGAPGGPETGAFALVGAQSGRCVDVRPAPLPDGARVRLWSCDGGAGQQWTATADGGLRGHGDTCLAAAGPGTAVRTQPCGPGADQRWDLRSDGTVRAASSGLCLDAEGAATADGTRVIVWPCNGQANQRWARR
ncbi:ricin-type beta-trefoil lectin domain protein [Streptomyces sp. TRM 70351]|nr:ricin-type beta-trefoil lectin domain protein [Streptomyces sp. TRM 70351]MEE1928989.1 ricin-type beta-trefoil lectin domain protein [Streptomyces sp. TRM 70351]